MKRSWKPNRFFKTVITGMFFLCFAPAHGLGQTREELDYIADSLLQTATHEQRALGIIQAIDWESRIIKDIHSLSPVLASNLSRINISSKFGSRFHPIYQRSHHHSGIDIPPPPGNDTIYAPANGIIDTIGYDNRLGYFIRIHHKYGYQTTYGHLRHVLASISDPILIGDPIALIGSTGTSTGPHLHYSVKYRGKLVNPLPYCYLMYDYLLQYNESKERNKYN